MNTVIHKNVITHLALAVLIMKQICAKNILNVLWYVMRGKT